jgi:hypothetical protein
LNFKLLRLREKKINLLSVNLRNIQDGMDNMGFFSMITLIDKAALLICSHKSRPWEAGRD